MTMKTIPEGMRPYERLELYGTEALSDAELLAVLLRSGTKGKTVLTLAEELLMEYGGLSDLGVAELSGLRSRRGIGRVKAIQLLAAAELGRRMIYGGTKKKLKLCNCQYLGQMLIAEMRRLRQEVFQVLYFDKKWNYISKNQISVGTVDRTLVHPREVFYHAIRNLASAVVLVHNHPSGDCTPSRADYDTTERIVQAGRLVGIDVADHMIIGGNEFYSMHSRGDMERIKEKMINEGSVYGT